MSSDGSCGIIDGNPVLCNDSPWGDCCASNGTCGNSSYFCGQGCQGEYGKCISSHSSLSFSTPTSLAPSSSATFSSTEPFSSSSTGIAIIVVCALLGTALIALAIWFACRRRRQSQRPISMTAPIPEPESPLHLTSETLQSLQTSYQESSLGQTTHGPGLTAEQRMGQAAPSRPNSDGTRAETVEDLDKVGSLPLHAKPAIDLTRSNSTMSRGSHSSRPGGGWMN